MIVCDKCDVQTEGSFVEVITETACILRHLREKMLALKGEEKADYYMKKLSEIATMPTKDFDSEIERMFKEMQENRFNILAAQIFMRRV